MGKDKKQPVDTAPAKGGKKGGGKKKGGKKK